MLSLWHFPERKRAKKAKARLGREDGTDPIVTVDTVELGNYNRYRLRFKDKEISSIEMGRQETNRFVSPDNQNKLPKLYVIRSRAKAIYIGQTTQAMRTRIRYGLRAKGKTGYYGYKWKDLAEVEVLVWCFPDKSVQYVEAVEGELVFLVRKHTGRWPEYQMEIHFHNASENEIEVAEAIFKESY